MNLMELLIGFIIMDCKLNEIVEIYDQLKYESKISKPTYDHYSKLDNLELALSCLIDWIDKDVFIPCWSYFSIYYRVQEVQDELS